MDRVPAAEPPAVPGAAPEGAGAVAIETMSFSDLFAVRGIERRSFPDAWGLGALLGEFLNRRGLRLVGRAGGQVVGYAFGWWADVELHVMTSPGHTIHKTAHPEAAAWLLAHVPAGNAK